MHLMILIWMSHWTWMQLRLLPMVVQGIETRYQQQCWLRPLPCDLQSSSQVHLSGCTRRACTPGARSLGNGHPQMS
jgi:hypothetical protein